MKLIPKIAVGLAALVAATACSSSAPVSREGVVVDVLIDSPDSRALPIAAAECRELLADALEDEGLTVARSEDDIARIDSRTNVTLTLSRGAIDLVGRDSTTARVLYWLFLGPGYFFMHDHTFELRCEPSLALSDNAGRPLSPPARYPEVRVREELNYNEWSQRLSFYLLSNLVPPFWADPDAEVLTRNLFASTARALARDVAQALRDPAAWEARRARLLASAEEKPAPPPPVTAAPEPPRRYLVARINPDVQSPVEVLAPRAGVAVVGTSLAVKLALTRPEMIQGIVAGERSFAPPFTEKILELEAPIADRRARIKVLGGDPPLTIAITLEDAPPPPKTYVLRRINPVLKGPVQVRAPKVGERISGDEVPLSLVITQPDLVDAIELGSSTAQAPFESLKIDRVIGLRDGRIKLIIRKRGEPTIVIALEFEELEEAAAAAGPKQPEKK